MKNKGITLVALVITIIVMLILAAVTIGQITKENGLINKVNQAQKANKKAEYYEKINLEIMNEQIERKTDKKNNTFIEGLKEKIDKLDFVSNSIIAKETNKGTFINATVIEANILLIETKDGYRIIVEVDNNIFLARIRDKFEEYKEKFPATFSITISNLAATSFTINVNSDEPMSNIDYYEYYCNGNLVQSTSATSYAYTGLTSEETYNNIYVIAYNKENCSTKSTNQANVKTPHGHNNSCYETSSETNYFLCSPQPFYGNTYMGSLKSAKETVVGWWVGARDQTLYCLYKNKYNVVSYIKDNGQRIIGSFYRYKSAIGSFDAVSGSLVNYYIYGTLTTSTLTCANKFAGSVAYSNMQ